MERWQLNGDLMKIEFQYVDWSRWIGDPADVADSPDKGVIRMWGIDDSDRKVIFVYDDFYYVFPNGDGTYTVGSGTNRREFILEPGRDGAIAQERFKLPKDAVVRLGQQVVQTVAEDFGLIDEGGKLLSEKATVYVEIASG